ncbi:hypothetical protein MLD38_040633 [Melastoma candidum]|nr:hypothetical protein MLD38_040633 [Melastoma candidum]
MFRIRLLLFAAVFSAGVDRLGSYTDPGDSAALESLKRIWKNTHQVGTREGTLAAFRGMVSPAKTRGGLSSQNINGQLSGDIGGLSELRLLDLSYNIDIGGPLTSKIGNLQKLSTLILAGCSFTGSIPDELGNLRALTFLALNTNKFTGRIPYSLGKLSKLQWLDLAENQLTGGIPVSPGLESLHNCKHFHFNKNQLTGAIPATLFSSNMILLHVLFDSNQLTGPIPSSIGQVQALEVLRLDRNALSGQIPSSISNLTNLNEMHMAFNRLNGSLPDLTNMSSLSYVDLSNNYFDPSEAPTWFTNLPSLTTLVMEYGSLQGPLPGALFSIPQLQMVKLRNNAISGELTMSDNIGRDLEHVDLQNNRITSVSPNSMAYTNTLILSGNPVCNESSTRSSYCHDQQENRNPYSTSLSNCGVKSCQHYRKLNPQTCDCAYPYEGTLFFRGPSFRDLSNVNLFHQLETSLSTELGLGPRSVFLENPFFNADDYLQIQLALFPSSGIYFNRTEILRIGFDLSNQTYKPPKVFGPYYFIASPYAFSAQKFSMSTRAIIGITIGCAALFLGLLGIGFYAVRQKRRAEKAIYLSKPFASWAPSGKDTGGAPQLKGARWFSLDELKKCTNNFSERNEIGSGGYGKVYRGMLSNGQVVAIKRAQQGSMQGGQEFKTEIELLSRVHHRNLVGLVGFCFESGEQMLIYEFMPNGTLRESLSGTSGIHLDWRRRLRIALGSARGLTYLHELADPPIIHRDVKSTNILLDENLSAKVADFGLSKLVSDSQKGHVSTQVKGTLGYLDPEYYMTQQLTEKSDVYSFGVVMLELITAKQPIEKGKYIVREVRTAMNMNDDDGLCGLQDRIDCSIRDSGLLVGFSRFLDLALRCVEESASDRPTMSEVVKTIENILQNDGMNTNSTSASSSATEYGFPKGSSRHHPYNKGLPKGYSTANHSDSFDYSGGYMVPTKVEPK